MTISNPHKVFGIHPKIVHVSIVVVDLKDKHSLVFDNFIHMECNSDYYTLSHSHLFYHLSNLQVSIPYSWPCHCCFPLFVWLFGWLIDWLNFESHWVTPGSFVWPWVWNCLLEPDGLLSGTQLKTSSSRPWEYVSIQ